MAIDRAAHMGMGIWACMNAATTHTVARLAAANLAAVWATLCPGTTDTLLYAVEPASQARIPTAATTTTTMSKHHKQNPDKIPEITLASASRARFSAAASRWAAASWLT